MSKSVIELSQNACAERNEVPILQFVYTFVSFLAVLRQAQQAAW